MIIFTFIPCIYLAVTNYIKLITAERGILRLLTPWVQIRSFLSHLVDFLWPNAVQEIHFKTSWWYYPKKLLTCSPFNHFLEKKENTPWYTDVSLYYRCRSTSLAWRRRWLPCLRLIRAGQLGPMGSWMGHTKNSRGFSICGGSVSLYNSLDLQLTDKTFVMTHVAFWTSFSFIKRTGQPPSRALQ